MRGGQIAHRQHNSEPLEAGRDRFRDPFPIGPLLVRWVERPLPAAVGEEARPPVVPEGPDLRVEESVELRGVRPSLPLDEHRLVQVVPPDGGDSWNAEVDVLRLAHAEGHRTYGSAEHELVNQTDCG